MSKAEKENIIKIAKHHKKHCDGETCTISLWLLILTAERAGIRFTKKERRVFL